jgi:hypothetical protein
LLKKKEEEEEISSGYIRIFSNSILVGKLKAELVTFFCVFSFQ